MIGEDHFGFSISGAAAEFFVARPEWLHRLPDQLSCTMGALVEPFSVAYYALVRAGSVNASDTVVVLGAGPVGLAVVAAVPSRWVPSSSWSSPPTTAGRPRSRSVPGTPWHPDDVDALLAERHRRPRRRVVVEVSGRPAVMAQALELAAFQGRVAYIGIDVGQEAPAKLGLIQSKELADHRLDRLAGRVAGDPAVPRQQRDRPVPAGHPAVRHRRRHSTRWTPRTTRRRRSRRTSSSRAQLLSGGHRGRTLTG